MKAFFLNFFHNFGDSWKWFANGIMGGLVWSIYKKLSYVDAFRQIFIGGVVSMYVTPIIVNKVSITYLGFISFTCGIGGLVILDTLFSWIVKKIKLLL